MDIRIFRFYFLFIFKDFIYLFERAREGGVSEGEADSPLSREPDVGLDPETPGS